MEKDYVLPSVDHSNKCRSCLSITNLCQETRETKRVDNRENSSYHDEIKL